MTLNQFNFSELKLNEKDLYHSRSECGPGGFYQRIHMIEHYSSNHNCFEFIQCGWQDRAIKCTLVYGNFTYSKSFYLNNYVSNSSHDITILPDSTDLRLLILHDDDDESDATIPISLDQDQLEADIRMFFTQAEKMTKSYFNSQVEASRI
jgi:hypothetical protein